MVLCDRFHKLVVGHTSLSKMKVDYFASVLLLMLGIHPSHIIDKKEEKRQSFLRQYECISST